MQPEAIKLLSHDQLDDILFHAKNAITITNLQGQILYANKGFTELTGYSLEEVYGKKPGTVLQGEETSPNTVEKIRDAIRQKLPVQEKLINYHKSGQPYWTQLNIHPIYDEENNPKYFVSIQSKLANQTISNHKQRVKESELASMIRKAYMCDTTDDSLLSKMFIVDQPKEDIGGAFYFYKEIQNKIVIFTGDTGYTGTPGAQLAALYTSYLRELLEKYKTLSPALIINKLKEKVTSVFNNTATNFADSLETSLVFVDEFKKKITYTTSSQVIYLIGSDTNKKLKGTPNSDNSEEYKDQTYDYADHVMIYLSSNGLEQQHNKKGDAFSSQQLHYLLTGVYDQNVETQEAEIKTAIAEWMKPNIEQVKDIVLLGVKL